MDIIILVFQILAGVSGSIAALLGITLFLRLSWPAPVLWFLKLYVAALSPLLALIGVFSAVVGLATGSVFISLIGIYDVLIFCIHIFRVTRPPGSSSSFEQAFGLHWENRISARTKKILSFKTHSIKVTCCSESTHGTKHFICNHSRHRPKTIV